MDVVSAEIVRIVKECVERGEIKPRQAQIYIAYHFTDPRPSMYAIGKRMGIAVGLVHREYHRALPVVTAAIAAWEKTVIVIPTQAAEESETRFRVSCAKGHTVLDLVDTTARDAAKVA